MFESIEYNQDDYFNELFSGECEQIASKNLRGMYRTAYYQELHPHVKKHMVRRGTKPTIFRGQFMELIRLIIRDGWEDGIEQWHERMEEQTLEEAVPDRSSDSS